MTIETHPIQIPRQHSRRHPVAPAVVTRRAYEVYHYLYPDQTLERLNERGGFGVGELVGFLYAYSFPKEEWDKRVQEAFSGMDLD